MHPDLKCATAGVSAQEVMTGISTMVSLELVSFLRTYLIVNRMLLFLAKLTASCTSLTVVALTTNAGELTSLQLDSGGAALAAGTGHGLCKVHCPNGTSGSSLLDEISQMSTEGEVCKYIREESIALTSPDVRTLCSILVLALIAGSSGWNTLKQCSSKTHVQGTPLRR